MARRGIGACRAPIAIVVAVVAVAIVGCKADGQPRLACSTPQEGHEIVEPDPAFRLCLPPNWRRLLPGDPGWNTVYGGHSPVEDEVASGAIGVFAVPLEPQESDIFLNLTIYSRDLRPGDTVESVAAGYERAVRTLEPAVLDLVVDSVTLNAGPAVRVAATRPKGGGGDRFSAYVLLAGDQAVFVIYTCDVDTVDEYEEMFLESANSLELR